MTYDLEAELCGTEHLKKAPVVQRTVEFYKPSSARSRAADGKIAGFFAPGKRGGSAGEEDPSKPAHENNFSAFEYWREPLPAIDLDLDAAGELLHDAPSPSGSDTHFGAADLPSLEAFLQTRSFLCSYELSAVDRLVAAQLLASCGSSTLAAFCNVSRWLRQVGSYTAKDTGAASSPSLCVAAIRRRLTAAENFNPEDVTAAASSSQTVDDVSDQQHQHQQVSSDEGVSMDDSDKENGDEEYDDDEYDDDGDDDDDVGWITPGNVKEKRAAMAGRGEEEAETRVRVACMTTDFAMQNVLKQIGLNIVGTNGMIIRVSAPCPQLFFSFFIIKFWVIENGRCCKQGLPTAT